MRPSPTGPSRFARLAALTLITGTVLGGCATPTPISTRTTVVLLPDEDSKVGALSMASASGTQRLDEAFSTSTVNGATAAPSQARSLSRDAVNRRYAELLKAQPLPPRSFVLYFLLDKTELTEASRTELAAVLSAVRERKPTSITVFGHTDAIGSREWNMKLSAERAQFAADLLTRNDPTLTDIEVQYFGDTQPLPATGQRAAEPRNRRVEILMF